MTLYLHLTSTESTAPDVRTSSSVMFLKALAVVTQQRGDGDAAHFLSANSVYQKNKSKLCSFPVMSLVLGREEWSVLLIHPGNNKTNSPNSPHLRMIAGKNPLFKNKNEILVND